MNVPNPTATRMILSGVAALGTAAVVSVGALTQLPSAEAAPPSKTSAPIGSTLNTARFDATVAKVSEGSPTDAEVKVCAKVPAGAPKVRVSLDSWLRQDAIGNLQMGGVMAGDDDQSSFPYGDGARPNGEDERARYLADGECASGTVAFEAGNDTGQRTSAIHFISGIQDRLTWVTK